jgi:hypothetical protein
MNHESDERLTALKRKIEREAPTVRLTVEREARQLSKARLSRISDVNDTRIRQAEMHGLRLSSSELARIVAALSTVEPFTDDPAILLLEIDD